MLSLGRDPCTIAPQLKSRRRKWFNLIIVVFVGPTLFNLLSESALSEQCPSPVKTPHNQGSESFSTSSRVYRQANVHVYETCVENTSAKDIWVNWLIPGPRSYVLQGKALPSPRAHVTRETESLEGCLEYGSTAALTQAQFLGHIKDTPAVEREKKEGCRAAAKAVQASADRFSGFSLPIEAYVPSDKDNPGATMLHFMGRVAAEERDAETYATTIKYSLKPVPSAKRADPSELRLRPLLEEASPFAAERVGSRFKQAYSDGFVALTAEGALEVSLQRTPRMVIENVAYGFFDRKSRFVGAIYVPHWLPEPR